jgi:hypothetical protein
MNNVMEISSQAAARIAWIMKDGYWSEIDCVYLFLNTCEDSMMFKLKEAYHSSLASPTGFEPVSPA